MKNRGTTNFGASEISGFWAMVMSRTFLLGFLVLVVLCLFLFFYRLADRDLWSSHEGRAAQDAQTMLWDDSWGLPRLYDGRTDLQKPPFYYWLVASLGWLRGGEVDAWAVRLPAALAATAGVLWVFLLGCLGRKTVGGFLAAVFLATMVHYTSLARTGRIDMVLCFTVSLALGCFYLGKSASRSYARCLWLLFGYVAVAASVLLKGPIGLALPLAVAGVFLLCERELPSPMRWKAWGKLVHHYGLWWGVPLVMGITLPWFLWANGVTNGKFFEVFLWYHNLERALGGSETLASRPWWYYGPRVLVDFLPWTLLLPVAVWLLVRRSRSRARSKRSEMVFPGYFVRGFFAYFVRGSVDPISTRLSHAGNLCSWWRQEPLARFAVVWFLVIFGVLSLAQFKRADYLLPAYPAAALILGLATTRWLGETEFSRRKALILGMVIVMYALGWWVYLSHVLPTQEPHREQRRFAELIRKHVPHPAPIIFFRVEDHTLAFHVGRPIDTILEWENIDTWASRPGTFYMVMTPHAARNWRLHVTSGRLEEVARNTDLAGGKHESPLVLLRTRPKKE